MGKEKKQLMFSLSLSETWFVDLRKYEATSYFSYQLDSFGFWHTSIPWEPGQTLEKKKMI